MVRQRELEIIEMEIETDKHDADFRVKDGRISRCDGFVVLGVNVTTVGGVCATDEGDVLGTQLLLDAGLADYEDFALGAGEVEDARDVD